MTPAKKWSEAIAAVRTLKPPSFRSWLGNDKYFDADINENGALHVYFSNRDSSVRSEGNNIRPEDAIRLADWIKEHFSEER